MRRVYQFRHTRFTKCAAAGRDAETYKAGSGRWQPKFGRPEGHATRAPIAKSPGFGPAFIMIDRRQSVATLTRLDAALGRLCTGIEPVAPHNLLLAEALGSVAAEMPLRHGGWPSCDTAATDGWALRAADIVGASAYSPVPLPVAPAWVEVGSVLPAGCDCVIDAERIVRAGTMLHAVAEALPGEGVRRAGTDISDAAILAAGKRIGVRDLAMARTIGLTRLPVRRPRVHVLAIPAADGHDVTAPLIEALLRNEGADVVMTGVAARDIRSIADAMRGVTSERQCDLLLSIGGTGAGHTDATVTALAESGVVIAHGLAQRPGRTAALARIGSVPAIALPGTPGDALAVWYTAVEPVLDRLTGYRPRETQRLPLTRKIASTVGLAELVALTRSEAGWTPLASGDISLEQWARADAWLCVPEQSEGYAAGTAIDARLFCDGVASV